jgi:dihydrodipicolinate synthase/N-acetylneuraminate lyase
VLPKLAVAAYNAAAEAVKSPSPATFARAQELQDILTEADWVIVKAGIGGTKYALDKYVQQGLGGVPRKPLPPATDAIKKMVDQGIKKALELEKTL